MGLVELCGLLGALLIFWLIVFARRALGFTANRTLISIVAWQILSLVTGLIWTANTARPDLVRPVGWAAICLVIFAVPLAVGGLLDGLTRGRRSPVVVVVTVVLLAITIAGSTGAVGETIAPTRTETSIAGTPIPINSNTAQNGFSMAVKIPATSSKFSARDANLWVPPGWILHPDVRRSVVEMMMGQPGDPSLGATLNALHSLGGNTLQNAPFVLVVDQLGGRHLNPPCRNTVAGQITTYLSVDVPRWIRNNLPVPSERKYWTIAGFSEGGDCAEFLEATYPSLWANIMSVSGPDVPGTPNIPYAIKHYFGGSQAAFNAALTATALTSHGHYSNTVATFATGALDKKYGPGVIEVASLADQAGWHVSTLVVKGAGHVSPTLNDGLKFGYSKLLSTGRLPTDGATPTRFLCSAGASPSDCGADQLATLAGTVALLDLGLVVVFFLIKLVQYRRATP